MKPTLKAILPAVLCSCAPAVLTLCAHNGIYTGLLSVCRYPALIWQSPINAICWLKSKISHGKVIIHPVEFFCLSSNTIGKDWQRIILLILSICLWRQKKNSLETARWGLDTGLLKEGWYKFCWFAPAYCVGPTWCSVSMCSWYFAFMFWCTCGIGRHFFLQKMKCSGLAQNKKLA